VVGDLSIDRSRFGWWLVGLALGAAVLYVVYSVIGTFLPERRLATRGTRPPETRKEVQRSGKMK
jgi:uncharacterized membrane protein